MAGSLIFLRQPLSAFLVSLSWIFELFSLQVGGLPSLPNLQPDRTGFLHLGQVILLCVLRLFVGVCQLQVNSLLRRNLEFVSVIVGLYQLGLIRK